VARKKYKPTQTQLFAPSVESQLPADFYPAGAGTSPMFPRPPHELIQPLTRETTKEKFVMHSGSASTGATDVDRAESTDIEPPKTTDIEPPRIAEVQASNAAEVEADDQPAASANPTQAVERFLYGHFDNLPIVVVIVGTALFIAAMFWTDNSARALNSAIGFGWCLTRSVLVVAVSAILCIPLSFLGKSKELTPKLIVAGIAAIVAFSCGALFLLALIVMSYLDTNSSILPAASVPTPELSTDNPPP